MKKKTIRKKSILIYFLILIAVCAASACTSDSAKQDDKIIKAVISNEKDLVSLQLREIELEKYKENVEKLLYSYFKQSYIEDIDKRSSAGGLHALSIKTPIVYNVSKVYTDVKEESKTVFIDSPVDDSTSRFYKRYIFKEKDKWKLFQLREHYVVMEGPKKDDYKRIVELFTNYDGEPIEYSSVTIRE